LVISHSLLCPYDVRMTLFDRFTPIFPPFRVPYRLFSFFLHPDFFFYFGCLRIVRRLLSSERKVYLSRFPDCRSTGTSSSAGLFWIRSPPFRVFPSPSELYTLRLFPSFRLLGSSLHDRFPRFRSLVVLLTFRRLRFSPPAADTPLMRVFFCSDPHLLSVKRTGVIFSPCQAPP